MDKRIEGVVIDICDQSTKVRISVHSDCENCGMCPGSNAMVIDADNDVGAELGQHVLIENKASNMLLAAFTVYILPLLVIGIGVFLGYYLSSQLPISAVFLMIAGGIIFAVPVLYIVKRFDRSMQSEKPVIVKTIK